MPLAYTSYWGTAQWLLWVVVRSPRRFSSRAITTRQRITSCERYQCPLSNGESFLVWHQTNRAEKVFREQGLEAIKWYHSNGVPQVLTMEREIFSLYEQLKTKKEPLGGE